VGCGMKKVAFISLAGALLAGAVVSGAARAEQATKFNKATNTVNNIRQADPPKASTGTAGGIVGTPVSQFKPTVNITPAKPPPPPPRNLNPNGDPAVQKGIDSYKKPGT
jgi:hypothetical protein